MDNNRKVLTVGVYDYFHYGHLRFFNRARALGESWIVAVQDGDYILKYKPTANVLYTTEQRIEMIRELRCVDDVIIYKDVDEIVKQVDFDIFAVGEDQIHSGFKRAIEWCELNGKEVIRLSRTKGISSSEIKASLDRKTV